MRLQRQRGADSGIREQIHHYLESTTLWLSSFSVMVSLSFVVLKMISVPTGRRQKKKKIDKEGSTVRVEEGKSVR